MQNRDVMKYLPLTESTYYILLALAEPSHGYGVMQTVERISEGTVQLGPGTLYGALSTLEKEGLIHKVREQDRRKIYTLKPKGQQVLIAHLQRLDLMLRNGNEIRPLLGRIYEGED